MLTPSDIVYVVDLARDDMAKKIDNVAQRYMQRRDHDGDLIADAFNELAAELRKEIKSFDVLRKTTR